MVSELLITLGFSVVSALLYRAGGTGFPFNTKYRDFGCPLIAIFWLLIFGISGWWQFILVFGLMFGALTTYMDSIFGYDNFYAHGALVGLAAFPLIWCGIAWWLILIRLVVLALGMGLWSEGKKNCFWKELGRGALIIMTLPICLI